MEISNLEVSKNPDLGFLSHRFSSFRNFTKSAPSTTHLHTQNAPFEEKKDLLKAPLYVKVQECIFYVLKLFDKIWISQELNVFLDFQGFSTFFAIFYESKNVCPGPL
jgi:hypothetical protein